MNCGEFFSPFILICHQNVCKKPQLMECHTKNTHTNTHALTFDIFDRIYLCFDILIFAFICVYVTYILPLNWSSSRLQTYHQNDITRMIGSQRLLGCIVAFCVPHTTYANWIFWFLRQQTIIMCLMCRSEMTKWGNSNSRHGLIVIPKPETIYSWSGNILIY